MGIQNGAAQFSGSLRNVCVLADLKMKRLLNAIDDSMPADENAGPAEHFDNTRLDENPVLNIDLDDASIRTIIWATGFRPDYSWLDVPVLDRTGKIRPAGGVVDAPGMYVVGLPMLRRRKSSFIHGIEDDVRDLTAHLHDFLGTELRLAG